MKEIGTMSMQRTTNNLCISDVLKYCSLLTTYRDVNHIDLLTT